MEQGKRACFALIAAAIVNRREYLSVYDFQIGGHLSISVSNVKTSTPTFYDHNRGGAISGSLNGMYDFPSSSHVSMTINDNQVNCYDFESGYHISFNVNANSVSAYDFADSCHYNYSVN